MIWTNNDEQCSAHSTFPLRSAGMSVKWHPDDSEKVLIAEKKGVIHMYNVVSLLMLLMLNKKGKVTGLYLRHLNKLYCQWKPLNRR